MWKAHTSSNEKEYTEQYDHLVDSVNELQTILRSSHSSSLATFEEGSRSGAPNLHEMPKEAEMVKAGLTKLCEKSTIPLPTNSEDTRTAVDCINSATMALRNAIQVYQTLDHLPAHQFDFKSFYNSVLNLCTDLRKAAYLVGESSGQKGRLLQAAQVFTKVSLLLVDKLCTQHIDTINKACTLWSKGVNAASAKLPDIANKVEQAANEASSLPLCPICGKDITSTYIPVGEDKVHVACFICSSCKQQLEGKQYATIEAQAICKSCLIEQGLLKAS